MPRKATNTVVTDVTDTDTADNQVLTTETSMEEKMDQILIYLHRMDRRDRLRTFGGFFRGILGLIPLILVVWSAWYFYAYSDEMIEKITSEAVKQTTGYTNDAGFMDQFNEYFNKQQVPQQ
jgi:hypothetical protein